MRSSVSYRAFDVDGADLAAVRRDIAYRAPQALRTPRAQAETRIRYRWNVRYRAIGDGCVATDPLVGLDVTIVLPRWRGVDAAPQWQQAVWQEYHEALRRHEEQHRAIAVETAHELGHLLRSAPRDRSCGALARLIGDAIDRIMAEERRRQSHFDRISPFVTLH